MEAIRFLHTADLHLDSPFKGMAAAGPEQLARMQQSTFAAFERFIAYAVREQPDFILIVGDIYDGDDRSLRAQIRFRQGMQQLADVGIPVFLSYGNHDHLAGSWTRVSLPENAHVFGGEVEEKRLTVRDEEVSIYGFSYPKRHVTEPMTGFYPEAEPGRIHIGMLHGSADGDSAHATYAPFTIEQLRRKQYDYWALGHIHKRSTLAEHPPVVYPGNLQGRHRNEEGAKGFYDVRLSRGDCTLQFVETSDIQFVSITVSCAQLQYADDLLIRCQEAIDRTASEKGNMIVSLVMKSVPDELLAAASGEDWLEILREQYDGLEPFVWISTIEWPEIARDDLPVGLFEPVARTLMHWKPGDLTGLSKELYSHRAGRYLKPLTDQDLSSLKEKAADLLANELLKER